MNTYKYLKQAGITPQQVEDEAERLVKIGICDADHPDLHEEAAGILLFQHDLDNWRGR
jgi:hypothetical protein